MTIEEIKYWLSTISRKDLKDTYTPKAADLVLEARDAAIKIIEQREN